MSIARTDRPEPTVPVINPTDDDMNDPLFLAIWQAIKGWDIRREPGLGYAHATGSDVMTILAAIRYGIHHTPDTQRGADRVRELRVTSDQVEEFVALLGDSLLADICRDWLDMQARERVQRKVFTDLAADLREAGDFETAGIIVALLEVESTEMEGHR